MANITLRLKQLLLLFSVFFIVSCGSESVLIVTDPFWDDFSAESSNFYNVKKYFNTFNSGIKPDFVSYQDPIQDFSLWIKDQISKKKYTSIILTSPLAAYLMETDLKIQTVIMSGFVKISTPDSDQVISTNMKAFFDAGSVMKSQWIEAKRLPVVILWNGEDDFEENYQAFLDGWGEEEDILKNNILILEQPNSDSEGKINSFYNRFDFREGKWCLFASAEPVLDDILNTWPKEDNITGILTSADQDYLPKNIKYLIKRDFMGILLAAVNLCTTESAEQTVTVNTLFIKR